jgi:ribonuclease HI
VTNNTVWKAPESGWLKVNWDASVEKNQGRMGFGVVVRNEKGDVIAAQCQYALGLFDPAVAEARAALLGVHLCRERGFIRVHFEGDAQTVVKAVNSQEVDWSRMGLLVDDLRGELQSIQPWRMSFVNRKGNSAAHVYKFYKVERGRN